MRAQDDSAIRPEAAGTLDRDERLFDVVEEFERRQRAGEPVTVDAWLEAHPEFRDELSELLPGLVLMETVAQRVTEEAALEETLEAIPETIGEYRVERRIGRGGMGVVYLAVQESLGRRVALKVLPTTLEFDAGFLDRFRREAQVAGRLAHPNIVPVYGVGFAEGRHYFAMRYVDGTSLDEVVRRMRARSGGARVHEPSSQTSRDRGSSTALSSTTQLQPFASGSVEAARAVRAVHDDSDALPASLSVRGAVRIALQVAEALEYAHGQGVLHRDIKPGNILLDRQGDAWVTDFGLCRIEDAGNLTSEGAILGTLRYMAPEQIEGTSHESSDVYAVGLVLFELLALRPAFDSARRARIVHDVLHTAPPRLRRVRAHVPRAVEVIVQKATAKLPDERYPSAAALARDLRAFLENRPIAARRPSAFYLARLFVTRHQLASTVAAISLVLLSVLGAVYVRDLRASRAESERMAYGSALVASEAALRGGSIQRAKHHLGRAPRAHRSWEWAHLSARVDQSLHSVRLTDGALRALATSSSGERVAVAGSQGATVLTLPALDVEFAAKDAAANAVAWDAAGERLAVAYRTGRIDVLERHASDVDGGVAYELIGRIHERWIGDQTSSEVAIREELALVGTDGGGVHLWDFERWAILPLTTLPGPVVAVGLELEDDGTPFWWAASASTLVIGTGGGPRDPSGRGARGEQLRLDLPLGGDTVADILLDPDRESGVVATHGGVVFEFEVVGGSLRRLFGSEGSLAGLALDGGVLLAVGSDKLVHVIDRDSRRHRRGLSGSPHPLNAVAMSHGRSPLALTAGEDGVLRAWDRDVSGGSVTLVGHVDEVLACALEPSGRLLATGGRDGLVIVWDLVRASPVADLRGVGGAVVTATFLRDAAGRRSAGLFAATDEGEVWCWRPEWLAPDGPDCDGVSSRLDGRRVRDSAWDAHGQRLLVATSAGIVALADDLTVVGEPWIASEDVLALAIDDASARVVASTQEGRLVCLSANDGRVLWDVDVLHVSSGHGIALRPPPSKGDPFLGAYGTSTHGVLVFDVDTGRELRFLSSRAEDGEVGEQFVGAAFSPDGDRVLATTRNGLLSVWDVAKGEHVLDLRGHSFFGRRIVGAPEADLVVSVAADESIHVWTSRSTGELAARRDAAPAVRPPEDLRSVGEGLTRSAMIDGLWSELTATDEPLSGPSQVLVTSLYGRAPGDPVVAALYGLACSRVEPNAENRALMAFALDRLRTGDPRAAELRASVAAYDRARLLADTTLIRRSVEKARLRPNPPVQRAIGAFSSFVPWHLVAEFVGVAAPVMHVVREVRARIGRR